MTAINTNVSALNAQYYLANTNKEMESAMQRLSSGFKVNSAADDAAGWQLLAVWTPKHADLQWQSKMLTMLFP